MALQARSALPGPIAAGGSLFTSAIPTPWVTSQYSNTDPAKYGSLLRLCVALTVASTIAVRRFFTTDGSGPSNDGVLNQGASLTAGAYYAFDVWVPPGGSVDFICAVATGVAIADAFWLEP